MVHLWGFSCVGSKAREALAGGHNHTAALQPNVSG